MLEQIKKYAFEKYAGDNTLADEFVRGFTAVSLQKYAQEKELVSGKLGRDLGLVDIKSHGEIALNAARLHNEQFTGKLMHGFSESVGKGVGGLIISGAVGALGAAYGKIAKGALHTKFLTALAHVAKYNPIIRNADKEKVLQYAETIFKFAPNVASDPNLLSSIIANAIHGEGIDPMTIKTLTSLEGEYAHNNTFTPKTFI